MIFHRTLANKKSLRKSGINEPIQMAAIMLLFILGVVTFPTSKIVGCFYKGNDRLVFLLADGIERIIFTAIMLKIIVDFGFRFTPKKPCFTGLLAVLPALIIAINNFPFVSYFNGNCSISASPKDLCFYTVWSLGVGLFEEVAFRGVMLPLIYVKLRDKKRPVFFTLAISSAIFALTHLINLLNGFNPAVFLQVGYTFLIGAMCGIVFVKTGNVFFSAIIHIIYNFGGMLIEYCGSGTMWTIPQIICTAVVGGIIGAYLIYVAITADKNNDVLEQVVCAEDINEWKISANKETTTN